ncbi:uncharacterized protein B0P05DRAFT_536783 [Gilbertella persicaria]|uniref:uncharacterized protein n=1 Tax=Gilbertella persicaria TaxID=101096 RepID=UPI00221F7982|nr:uncharacterized protein B0P05DRAFT_536783 [Gilbertella persicaria]KAI8083281.1 hypothetical protein B0P05DRAFT_536783 [Gilbertella persicaria]
MAIAFHFIERTNLQKRGIQGILTPIQPSMVSMEAALPVKLQPLLLKPNPKLQIVLPPPFTLLAENDKQDAISKEPLVRKASIPLLLNPVKEKTASLGIKQYICTFCQKKFMRPSSLKIHTYSHTGEKPFHCSYPGCRRKFSVQSNMRRHLRVHCD